MKNQKGLGTQKGLNVQLRSTDIIDFNQSMIPVEYKWYQNGKWFNYLYVIIYVTLFT